MHKLWICLAVLMQEYLKGFRGVSSGVREVPVGQYGVRSMLVVSVIRLTMIILNILS
jgi:hypothetical protein